ncbi:hypothetical protein B566_EDAN013014 [Ephemera danica]|nr:hypothetical protein B566_EDAN013014 [Ephemera danica]
MELIITIILVIIVFYLFMIHRRSNSSNFPPGPFIFPILGSLPSCSQYAISMLKGKTRHELAWQMSQKYGPITGLMIESTPVVMLHGYETIKQAFLREEFANKPPDRHPVNIDGYSNQMGIVFHNGPGWREQRRFALRHLRDFGFGRRSMEVYIHEEAQALFNIMETHEDYDLLHLLPLLSIRLIWSIVAGGCKDENFDFKEFTRTVMSMFNENNAVLGMIWPVLNKIPVLNASYLRLCEKTEYVLRVVKASIKNHEESFDENDIRDFIDVYIQELRANKSTDSSFSREQLCAICVDLFNGGTETTAETLAYALRHLIQNTEIQNKLRNEIHTVVGE